MTPKAWRIVKTRQMGGAFSGEDARATGDRWNSPGTAVVYASWTGSLALLEMLVHLEGSRIVESFSLIPLEFDKSMVTELEVKSLPPDWRAQPAPSSTRAIGDRWVAEARSPVLRLPSVIVAHESNYLLNPDHPRFDEVRIGRPRLFPLDQRLV
ncbi:MAG TPA: RES family NAD+ phosphorylase [Gemmatimonadota bacterium]|nr:RES family NAD+ phosphorylase [Gemmatimonadota bacterium]